jgi:hypothetical protein
MSEAYNLIDELGTASVQDLLQTVSFEDEFEKLPELVD